MDINTPPADVGDFAIMLGKYRARLAKWTFLQELPDYFSALYVLYFFFLTTSAHMYLPRLWTGLGYQTPSVHLARPKELDRWAYLPCHYQPAFCDAD